MKRTEPSPGAPYRTVTVCRIEPKKGLLDLVEAIHLLRRRGVRVEAHIIGTTDDWSAASRDYKRKLDARIAELDLWGTVHFEGQQNLDGILRFLGNAQLFVAPFVETDSGDKDGIPTALLEAMSTGLPTVATDAGSITEVIDDAREGILVPQFRPDALADAVETLLQDQIRRGRLGENAAKRVRRSYDVRNCEKDFHERIRATIQSRV
jgi:glycosyltransferase involved in cell wall biosynthesis